MPQKNPYAISFGRIPNQYISRDVLIDDITEELNSDIVTEQAFKLTGIRGTGKTVTLTALEKELKNDDRWIIVNLRSNSEITKDLLANLYSDVPFLTKFVDASLNLSAFGIGLNLTNRSPVASIDSALKQILSEIKKRGKRVLIAIDEARKTDAMVDFIQEFQILIREEYPVYLIIAGLYEDIESIENTDGLTFFLRAAKYEMKPLNIKVIQEDYKETLKLSDEKASELAKMTKGYAFAYQVFGKYMWESHNKEISSIVLAKVDDALSEKVYDKIWSELTQKDKWFLGFIVRKDKMSASELLEMTKKKHNEWSVPRKHLVDKGIIDGSVRGTITLKLPRFKEYVENQSQEI
ncbi:MAG: ATP-binding protein [Lachnospiraceae bacterium]|nr:ATP-binding protein [Lachnospiraceae bacterium]MBQ8955403.1 ATP-binding protein [Lachnospiraceae bacterium]